MDGACSAYVFRTADSVPEETRRLDELYAGIKTYLGGALSLATLDADSVSSILEVGSGSGAWAIQAATEYPDAKVTAIDMNPLPPRPLPANLSFQRADVTQPLPFPEASFDVVHARLTLMHVPDGEGALLRIAALVKPGGWLLVEDPDDSSMADGAGPLGPGMAALLAAWTRILRSRGAEPHLGRHLERILARAGVFAEVHARKVTIPISGKTEDAALRALGDAWYTNMVRVGRDLPARHAAAGITEEVASGFLEELQDRSRSLTTDLYFTWSRKKA